MKAFKVYQHQRILTTDQKLADGDYIIDDELIIRISNGFLNDVINTDMIILPAIEAMDGSHIEHWKNGVLHCDYEPAVIDIIDNYEEWWQNGIQVPSKK